ncbi:MAG: VPLPA-CTERM sorting domain-containing protein, partial [Pseudomonadota bacterium]
TLTFLNVVVPETRIFSLYLGGFRQGNGGADLNIDSSLSDSGGPIENAVTQSFRIRTTTIPDRTAVPFVYTLEFSSDTATDLSVTVGVDSAGGNIRNFGIAGFTIEQPAPITPPAPVPVPAGLPLLIVGLGAIGLVKRSSTLRAQV